MNRSEIYLRFFHVKKLLCVIYIVVSEYNIFLYDLAAATSIFIHVTVLKSEGAQNYTNTDLYLISAKIQSQFLSQQEIAMHCWV